MQILNEREYLLNLVAKFKTFAEKKNLEKEIWLETLMSHIPFVEVVQYIADFSPLVNKIEKSEVLYDKTENI